METHDIQDNFVFFSERDLFANPNNHHLNQLFTFHRLELLESFLSKIDEKYILFDCLDEYEPPVFIESDFWNILNDKLKKSQKYLVFLIASEHQKIYEHVPWINTNLIKINIPLSSIFWVIQEYKNKNFFSSNKTDRIPQYFIRCFNRAPHNHRCILIDVLSKYGLIDNNQISWNILTKDFDFKYFKQRKLLVDHDLNNIHQNSIMFNQRMVSSVFDLVTESNVKYLFYSEKTWKSYLQNNAISIFLGSRYQNISLKKYGFQMYDEIINYKFDTYIQYEDRVESLIEQIHKLRERNYQEIIETVEKKIEFNYKNVLDIFNDKKYIDTHFNSIFDTTFKSKIQKTVFNETLGVKTLNNLTY